MTRPIEFKKTIAPNETGPVCDILAKGTGLSKSRIKHAMNCGAAWLKRPGGPTHRIRRATTMLRAGERVELYYDEKILNRKPPPAQCRHDYQRYSIWFKPCGLTTQGSRFGDHCALSRQVESYFKPARQLFLVHRLDRETAGLVIVAHDRKTAAVFSEMFKSRRIEKQYRAVVMGNPAAKDPDGIIDMPLDGRPSKTKYRLLEYDGATDQSLLSIQIITGRRHQIRRHFEMIGHPVIGDPRYGKGNKNSQGMQLAACGLRFECPLGNGRVEITIAPELIIALPR